MLPPAMVPPEVLRRRQRHVIALGFVLPAVNNMIVPRAYVAALDPTQNPYLLILLVGFCIGVIAAEIFVLAAYAAFGPQRWQHRVFIAWLLALLWSIAWGEGALSMSGTDWAAPDWRRHQVGLTALVALLSAAAAGLALSLIRRARRICFVSALQNDQGNQAPARRAHWSLLDLFILTSLCAVTFALLRAMLVGLQIHVGGGLTVLAVILGVVMLLSFLTCLVFMAQARPIYLFFPCVLVAFMAVIGVASNQFPVNILCGFLMVPTSYIATIVTAALAAHYGGWRLAPC